MSKVIEVIKIEVKNNLQKKDHLPDVTLSKEFNIPTSFYFNGSWKIIHICSNCEKTVGFGLETDGIKNWDYSFKQTKPINTKNYTLEVVKGLHSLIQNTVLVSTEKGTFLGLEKEFDHNFPFSSSLKLNYYRCNYCNQLHIMIGYILFGEIPERSSEKGQNDQWVIMNIFGVDNDLECLFKSI